MKLILPSLLLLSACGGTLAPAFDAGVPDTGVTETGVADTGVGECPVKTPGKNIWDVTPADCLQGLILEDHGGGFGPSPPPNSDCTGGAKYSLTVATKSLSWELSWEVCDSAQYPQQWKLVKGQRALTPTELASLATAMRQVVVSGATNTCGADKPLLTVTVVTPKYGQEYTDSIYQCQGQGKIYVDGIDGAFSTMSALAK